MEKKVLVPRPVLVISKEPLGQDESLIWTLMITNAEHEPWPGDIHIPQAEALGLLIPSKVRTAKIAPVEVRTASLIGRLDADTYAKVQAAVAQVIG